MRTRMAEVPPTVRQPARAAAGLLAPVALPVLALLLHQSGVLEVPGYAGALAVVIIAGLTCGLLLRSTWAAGWIFVVWAGWAVVALAGDDGTSDPPAGAMVLISLVSLAVPAMLAALAGVLVLKLWYAAHRW